MIPDVRNRPLGSTAGPRAMEPNDRSQPMNARHFAIWSYVTSALIVAGGVIGALLAPIDHDVAWHLYAAERNLDGDRLYVHLVEYNLPAAYYLSVPAVELATRIGLSSPLVFKLAILAAMAVSLALCRGRILAAGLRHAGWLFRRFHW